MAKPNLIKEKLIGEFKFLKEFEKWAGDFYRQIALSPEIKSQKMEDVFKHVTEDEYHHAVIIQKIINIINNNL